jgi:hypothetical protein
MGMVGVELHLPPTFKRGGWGLLPTAKAADLSTTTTRRWQHAFTCSTPPAQAGPYTAAAAQAGPYTYTTTTITTFISL